MDKNRSRAALIIMVVLAVAFMELSFLTASEKPDRSISEVMRDAVLHELYYGADYLSQRRHDWLIFHFIDFCSRLSAGDMVYFTHLPTPRRKNKWQVNLKTA